MTNVIELKKPIVADDIIAGLRGLADRIESGEVEGPITTAMVILGHTWETREGDDIGHHGWTDSYAFGPRCDLFTCRGLIASWEASQ
jgi:CobQ-like glutamine amidotransferase family enzyme